MEIATDGWVGRRVAIVTGGSRGIGRATVQRLADLGYAVVVNYVNDQQMAETVVEAILDGRGAAVAVRADVGDELDVERLFAATIEAFGAVHAVVHAVRGHVPLVALAETGLDDLDVLIRTGPRAAFIVNREATRHLREGGAIVNVTGSVTASSIAAYGAYTATSNLIATLTRLLAIDLLERGITVNAVSLDVDKPCVPDKVADFIGYLLSEVGHGITGQVIHIDYLPRGIDSLATDGAGTAVQGGEHDASTP